jgi:hypothetical protein
MHACITAKMPASAVGDCENKECQIFSLHGVPAVYDTGIPKTLDTTHIFATSGKYPKAPGKNEKAVTANRSQLGPAEK